MRNGKSENKAADAIQIQGARHHNLKSLNVRIPHNQLTVITGLSGSGKSSLAFDTLYAEGQRRYVESLSAYARQFLGQMQKPDVDTITGLPPAISIEQRVSGGNPRSTVGTTTEIYDYFRLLFARIGRQRCYSCGKYISIQSAEEIVNQILKLPQGTRVHILAPKIKGAKGEFKVLIQDIKKDGFLRVRLDGLICEVDQKIKIDKNKKHNLEIVIDRLILTEGLRSRCQESVEMALRQGDGIMLLEVLGEESREILFSEKNACTSCSISFSELQPRLFSFNSPYGACEACHGLGIIQKVDPRLIVPDDSISIEDGAIAGWRWGGRRQLIYQKRILKALAKGLNFSLDIPFKEIDASARKIILYGDPDSKVELQVWRAGSYHKMCGFEGIIPNLERRYVETDSEYAKTKIYSFMVDAPCTACQGKRLRPESLWVYIKDCNITNLCEISIDKLQKWFADLSLTDTEKIISQLILKEIQKRLNFLVDVGLGYLTLDRKSNTLSGGEVQRIRLATQIGSGLVGVLYILDEPSIGLHQRDNERLLQSLFQLRDMGNTLVVVEHDEAAIRNADLIIDLGPGAGIHGGEIVAQGTIDDILKAKRSLTGMYLRRELEIKVPKSRVPKDPERYIQILGASENNLKMLNVEIPLGLMVCITGVSGSGKSTLIDNILRPELERRINHSKATLGKFKKIFITDKIDKVIVIDQSPIGRTPRSNTATYTSLFSYIRDLFTLLPESKVRGYKPGRFSFNVKGGRCEACEGDGVKKIEMHFLPDIYVECEVCKGRRYNRETLEVKYKGKSIADILESSIEEAYILFKNIPRVKNILETLISVGLSYIKLGQSAMTLSGGEAQRIKLSSELSKRSTGQTLYMLDEPTTGLHFADIHKLLDVLMELRNRGNTVIVIEHNLDVIKTADYIIDLGPEGGDEGGYVVAQGTPEQIALAPQSYTGQFLKDVLRPHNIKVKEEASLENIIL